MPKGVEHSISEARENRMRGAKGSVMPKGVEHFGKAMSVKTAGARERISDAERR